MAGASLEATASGSRSAICFRHELADDQRQVGDAAMTTVPTPTASATAGETP